MLIKRTVIRCVIKPEIVKQNERLVEAVFQELWAESPDGFRYFAIKLGDRTFIHFRYGHRRQASRSQGRLAALAVSAGATSIR